jgi:putative membrane-bound dehydrogenase-like protein
MSVIRRRSLFIVHSTGLPVRFATIFLAILVTLSPLAAAQTKQAKSKAKLVPPKANEPLGNPGELPTGADGKPLNLNFESGTLQDWKAEGKAFDKQPVKGPIDPKRPYGEGKRSDHTGEFWIGGFEVLRDTPIGTLTSARFTLTQPFASFLLGGGSHPETRVELVLADDGTGKEKIVFTARGANQENMRPVIADLTDYQGKQIFVRIVDDHTGGWGHVNFDDFRLHEQRPKFQKPAPPPTIAAGPAPETTALYPFAGLDPAAAAKAMVVPPGFSVQVAAAEPDVQQPVAMAIDDRGRIWIAEAYEYPTRAAGDKGRDRILIFEDTNLDGKLDKRTVFYEGLNLVSGMEVGFGGVWVGAAPYLLFIPDKDGDDKPDGEPAKLLDGFGYEDTHETLNSFLWGPDGWLYGCHGVFTHSKVGKPGTPAETRIPLNAGIWRYHPVRHEFEVFAHGTSNPWGLDYDQYGNFFATACVIPHLFHIIPGARYERQAGQHFNPYTYNDIKTIADHRHYTGNQWNVQNRLQSDDLGGGHAHAGCMIYQGGAWPEKYRGAVFMNNIHGNRMNDDILEPKGSGFVGHHGPDFLLTRDQWSQMLDMDYGPDGQVWAIDWYDRNQCHRKEEGSHDRTNGRIYRIVYEGAKPVQVDLRSKSNTELVDLLKHENQWYVRHAQRLLQERAAEKKLTATVLADLLEREPAGPEGARELRNLWLIHSTFGVNAYLHAFAERLGKSAKEREEIHRDMIGLLLFDPSVSDVQCAWSILLLAEEDRSLHPEFEHFLIKVTAERKSPVVRLGIAAASQQLPLEDRWNILSALTNYSADAVDHNLPLMYWYAMEPLAEVDPARALALGMSAGENIPILKEYMIRRIGAGDPEKSWGLLTKGLAEAKDDATRLTFVRGMNESLKGRRELKTPAGWSETFKSLMQTENIELRMQLCSLAVAFGDKPVIETLRQMIADDKSDVEERRQAIGILARAKDVGAVPMLLSVLNNSQLRADALRALAVFDDAKIPFAILAVYSNLTPAERRDALATLASRTTFAAELLDAVGAGKVPSSDLAADLVSNLRNLNDEALNKRIEQVWGIVRASPADKAKMIAEYKQLVLGEDPQKADVQLGRAIFAKTCQNCHTLFGAGGKIGPDITGSQRANLDYLLSNVIDPSAVMAKEYQPLVVRLVDGRVVTGIKREETPQSLSLQTPTELIVIAKDEIEESKQSRLSMMPENQLPQFSPHEVRSLVAYLASPGQTPLLATRDNVGNFFNGKDLSGWIGDEKLWSVENGEIVGRTTGLKKNEFLISELSAGDFRLSVDVLLKDNAGNSGIQFRSEPIANGLAKGYQADIGVGWWGKLYEEHGRELLWEKSGESHVKPGEWNHYEVLAVGSRIRTWINGQPCVDLDDPFPAHPLGDGRGAGLPLRRGILAFQLHSGGPTDVRFRSLKLSLIGDGRAAGPYPTSTPVAKPDTKISFKRTAIDPRFRSEGVGYGDFNNDGLLDISAGSVWYEQPKQVDPAGKDPHPGPLPKGEGEKAWKMHVITDKPHEFDIKTYGDTFMNWAEDVDGDGKQDLIVVDFPGKQTWWFQNPGDKPVPWKRNVAVPATNNESPQFVDLDRDGHRELLFGSGAGRVAIARPVANPLQEWKSTAISAPQDVNVQKFYHGLGAGDVNRDGRDDVITPAGWWEAPAAQTAEPWPFHPAPFGEPQAQMYAFDFDGDGDNDIVGSSAHRRGIWWHEQTAQASGELQPSVSWKTHLIDDSIAQTHALVLADMNGDGLPDLVTGKRYYAHNGRDPGEDEPAHLAWFELSRQGDKPTWTKHLIDEDSGVGTQFEVVDISGDGLLDIISSNKRGTFYFEQVRE